MTNRFQLYKGTDVDLAALFPKIVGLVLSPAHPDGFLLLFIQLHIHHVCFQGYSSLLAGRCVPEKWEVQVLKEYPRGDSFLQGG